MLSGNAELVSRLAVECSKLADIARVQASTTAAESDLYTHSIFECDERPNHSKHFAVLNTGLIDRYESRWGLDVLTHAGRKYKKPCMKRDDTNISKMRQTLYTSPKLIVAKVAYVPEVCMDSTGEIAGLNVNFILESDIDLRYLLAIFNSRLMSYIYREFFGALTMQKGYAQFQAPQLRLLPVPTVEHTTPVDEREKFIAEFQRLYETVAETSHPERFGDLVDFISDCLSDHPQKLDVIHDILVFLADWIERLHVEKQHVAATFLEWVESPAGLNVNISDVKNQKRIERFYEDMNLGSDEAFRILESTIAKSRISIRPILLSDFRREYENTCAILRPLLKQIQLTETIVDYLVYRIYGLSMTEVASVEKCGEEEVRTKYCWPAK